MLIPALTLVAAMTAALDGTTASNAAQEPRTEQRLPALDSSVYPKGTTTEVEYAAWLEQQHQALAAAGGTIGANGHGLARQANWILAYHCEPPLTRLVLGIANASDVEALCSRLDAAVALLGKAQQQKLSGADSDRLDCLADMAKSLQQLCLSRRGQAQTSELEAAAADMSVWLDDDSPEVRESTRLILSLLNTELERFSSCLPILPKATAPIESSDVATAIFARAVRCRIQARMGHHVPALAVLLKMEEKCADWVATDDMSASAEATLAWFRLQVARDYPGELGVLARETLDDAIKDARAMVFEDDAPGLLRLHPAVPILFDAKAKLDQPDFEPEAVHEVKAAPD